MENQIVEILDDLGFAAIDNNVNNPHSECFVLTRNPSHCRRYRGDNDQNGQLVVMDPTDGSCSSISRSIFTEQSTTYVKINGLKKD